MITQTIAPDGAFKVWGSFRGDVPYATFLGLCVMGVWDLLNERDEE